MATRKEQEQARIDKYKLWKNNPTKIAMAVLPLREDAITSAEKYATDTVENVRKNLAAVNWDMDKVAPYPARNLLHYEEIIARHKHNLYSGLVTWREGSRSFNSKEPLYVDMKPEYCERFIKRRMEEAAEQYDLFVMKLEKKIGEVESAKLEGNHVWGYSFLKVVKPDGTQETWKTQQIGNVSKLGNHFPQWPSRKVKQ